MTTTITTISTRKIAIAVMVGATLLAGLSGCVPLVVGAAAVGSGMVATDRRTSGAQLDDEGIELRAGARVREIAGDAAHVNITSFNRQVLLTGEIPTTAVRQRIEETVTRIDNVSGVVNELGVAAPSSLQQRSIDTYITGKVKASLLDAKDIFANSYKVVTERNVVYLMGRVTRREADRATEVTRGVAGVEKVVRVLEVISEAELAGQGRTGGTSSTAPAASTSTPSTSTPAASSGSSVSLPPMAPLPSSTAKPVR
jgi:osmotically-inducible protein OsmY